MKITFLGAAGEVTGSQHLIETSSRRLLLDCGFFQGRREESRRRNEQLHCRPADLDAVILSHAHIDHCGNIPQLVKQGFRGPIFCTDATADVAELMLLDSAKIQLEDAAYLTRKLASPHPPVEPLYTVDDVRRATRLMEPCPFDEWIPVGEDVRIRFTPAGHILGSAITELELRDAGELKRVVFTGDLGRRDMPLLKDPAVLSGGADVLICESTYGNRVHSSPQDLEAILIQVFQEALQRGGRVIIPAFALGRTQQVVYYLNNLFNSGRLPRIPIFVDSPLANKVTQLFLRYSHTLDADVEEVLKRDSDPFGFSHLTYIQNQAESTALNHHKGAFAVISASGMCESGRVVHHLKHAVTESRNVVLLMGYQAPHTLGRQLADRRETVRMFGREYPLRAQVLQLDGLSAHADVTDFQWWFQKASERDSIAQVFLVHGEPAAAQGLANAIRDYCDEAPHIPTLGQSFEV